MSSSFSYSNLGPKTNRIKKITSKSVSTITKREGMKREVKKREIEETFLLIY